MDDRTELDQLFTVSVGNVNSDELGVAFGSATPGVPSPWQVRALQRVGFAFEAVIEADLEALVSNCASRESLCLAASW